MVVAIKVATRGCYTVLCAQMKEYTKRNLHKSSYKIPFYCQNSAHKTLQNDCKKYWLIFKPHQSTNFKGMFPQKSKGTVGRLFY